MDQKIMDRNIADIEGNTPLSLASYFNHIPVVKLLLEEVLSAENTGPVDADGFTALHWAANKGNVEIVTMLLEHGFHESTNNNGETALHLAARGGHTSTVRALLDHGFCVDAIDRHHFTPLLWAVQDHHVDTAALLLERGANYDLSLKKGREDVESLKPPKRHGPYKTHASYPRKEIVRQTVRR
jgi:ankyrin repeat protein